MQCGAEPSLDGVSDHQSNNMGMQYKCKAAWKVSKAAVVQKEMKQKKI